jgi:hypothetical protein
MTRALLTHTARAARVRRPAVPAAPRCTGVAGIRPAWAASRLAAGGTAAQRPAGLRGPG